MLPDGTPVQIPLADAVIERWLPVVGWETFYEVSDLGRVKRIKAATRTHSGRFLQQHINPYGYFTVNLSDKPTRTQQVRVHRLVIEAFIGLIPIGMVGNHLDGGKTHNTPANLEITTPEGNSKHAAEIGLYPRGDAHYMHLHPELRVRGDQHWTHRLPERIRRGEQSWSTTHTERLARGEHHGNARLTESAIREIRNLGGTMSQAKIGKRYGVSQVTIGLILCGKAWAHVT